MYLDFSILTVFLKNRNIIFKMKISKVTDYAALSKSFTDTGRQTSYNHKTYSSDELKSQPMAKACLQRLSAGKDIGRIRI